MTNTQTEWQPVALVAASLSNDDTTTIEVAVTGEGIYLAALNRDGDSVDTRMTKSEGIVLIQSLMAALGMVEKVSA